MRLTKWYMKGAACNTSSANKKPGSLPQAVEECLVEIGQIPPNSNLYTTKVSLYMFKFAALPKVVRASREPTPPLQGGSFPAKRSCGARSRIVERNTKSIYLQSE